MVPVASCEKFKILPRPFAVWPKTKPARVFHNMIQNKSKNGIQERYPENRSPECYGFDVSAHLRRY